MTAQQDARPNDEERGQPHVPKRTPLARSSSSVSFALARNMSYITSQQLGVLMKLDNWMIYDIPMQHWDQMPYVHRQEQAVAIFASGCFDQPKRLNGNLAAVGIDVVVHEAGPKKKGEDEINIYHFTIQKLARQTPDGHEYWMEGPYCRDALQGHWPSPKEALDFYAKVGTLLKA